MSKRLEAKYKINRRLGVNLWGRSKSPLAKGRENPPGQHGARRKKPSHGRPPLTTNELQAVNWAAPPVAETIARSTHRSLRTWSVRTVG